MRHGIIIMSFLFTAALSGLSGEVSAAPSNGTRFPPSRQVELGYEYNNMFKRQLDSSYGDLSTQDHFYTISFGAFDWLALDGKIGIGDVTLKKGNRLPRLEFNTGFAGGYGFRIRALSYEPWRMRLILGAQHISVHPPDRSADDDKYECFLDDWQISGLVAKDIKHMTIYTGLKGSDCEFVYKLNKADKKRRISENHIGFIGGVELYLFKDKARIGAEARFFDETAFSVTASYLF